MCSPICRSSFTQIEVLVGELMSVVLNENAEDAFENAEDGDVPQLIRKMVSSINHVKDLMTVQATKLERW